MKIGKIPVASLVLLVYVLIKQIIKYFFPDVRAVSGPYVDGGLIGALFVFGLYYANIYLTAWQRSRKEELAK
jgi:hypothetical protein